MKVFQAIAEAQGLSGCALALGNFDGVHLGHQALFAEAARHGAPVALTFDPHPGKILQPDLAPKLITTRARKLELFEHYGLHAAIVQPFTTDYAITSPEAFEASLLDQVGARHLVVGTDFTYGRKRAGTVTTLGEAAALRGAQVSVVAPVTVAGVVVSSSKVREMILEGRLGPAARLLGRFFDLDGTVVKGMGRGAGIGFPTANVDTDNELRPAPGVYAVQVCRQCPPSGADAEAGGQMWLPGAANIGVKPTFGGGEVTIEVHLIDYSGDLYGQRLRVQFLERLREERRFGSAQELATQIRRDVEAARTVAARVGE
jgi:riboflavin kinase / FMN adenylyltransferase